MISRYFQSVRDQANGANSLFEQWLRITKISLPWILAVAIPGFAAAWLANEESRPLVVMLATAPGILGWLTVNGIYIAALARKLDSESNG